MTRYRVLERVRGDHTASPFGLAYERADGVFLFVPEWRTQQRLGVTDLTRLNEDHFPQAPFHFRWSDIEEWTLGRESAFDPLEALLARAGREETAKAVMPTPRMNYSANVGNLDRSLDTTMYAGLGDLATTYGRSREGSAFTVHVIERTSEALSAGILAYLRASDKLRQRAGAIRECCAFALIGLHAYFRERGHEDRLEFEGVIQRFFDHPQASTEIVRQLAKVINGGTFEFQSLRQLFQTLGFDRATPPDYLNQPLSVFERSFLRAAIENKVVQPPPRAWHVRQLRSNMQVTAAAILANEHLLTEIAGYARFAQRLCESDVSLPHVTYVSEEERFVVSPDEGYAFTELDDPM